MGHQAAVIQAQKYIRVSLTKERVCVDGWVGGCGCIHLFGTCMWEQAKERKIEILTSLQSQIKIIFLSYFLGSFLLPPSESADK